VRKAPVRTRRDKITYLALCAVLVAGLLPHLASGGVFVLDDNPSILENGALLDSPVKVIMSSPFRAAAGLVNWANVQVCGFDAPAFEAVNGALHVMTSLLVFLLVKALFGERDNRNAVALAACALFCLNPLVNFSVFYISARSAILATMFTTGAALACIEYHRKKKSRFLWISMLACIAAALSKESGAVAPILVGALALLYGRGRERMTVAIPAGIILAAYAALRAGHLVYLGPPSRLPGSYQYLLTQLTVIPRYVGRFLWPTGLALELNPALKTSVLEPDVLVSGAVLIGAWTALTWGLRRIRPALFLMIWLPVTFAPESGPIPLMDLAFPHRAYMPAVGLAALTAYGTSRLFRAGAPSFKRKAAAAALAAVCCLYLAADARSASTWSSQISLHRRSARVSPDKFRARYDLGLALSDDLRYSAAWTHLNRAVQIGAPTDYEQAQALNALAKLRFRFKDYEGAAGDFIKAAGLRPGWAEPLENAGLAYLQTGNPGKALECFKRASALRPPDTQIRRAVIQAQRALGANGEGRR